MCEFYTNYTHNCHALSHYVALKLRLSNPFSGIKQHSTRLAAIYNLLLMTKLSRVLTRYLFKCLRLERGDSECQTLTD